MLRAFSILLLACLTAGAFTSPAVAAEDGARVIAVGGLDADVGDLAAGADEAQRTGLWQDIEVVRRGSMVAHLGAASLVEAMAALDEPRPTAAAGSRNAVGRVTEVRTVVRSTTRTVTAPESRRQPLTGLLVFGLGTVGLMMLVTGKPRVEPDAQAAARANRRYTPPGRPAMRRYPAAPALRQPLRATGLRRFAR